MANFKIMVNDSKKLNRIKAILAEKSLSNKWLSEKLGVGQATVSKWVTNSSQPSLDMLIQIAQVLDVDIKELIRVPNNDVIK